MPAAIFPLIDFHKLLGKASAEKRAPAFPQFPQRRRPYIKLQTQKREQLFQRKLTLMVAMEIRKDGGFPQPREQEGSQSKSKPFSERYWFSHSNRRGPTI